MIGLTPSSLQALYISTAPFMTPWSVRPSAGWPNSAARLARALMLHAPSSSEYSEWTCRGTAEGVLTGGFENRWRAGRRGVGPQRPSAGFPHAAAFLVGARTPGGAGQRGPGARSSQPSSGRPATGSPSTWASSGPAVAARTAAWRPEATCSVVGAGLSAEAGRISSGPSPEDRTRQRSAPLTATSTDSGLPAVHRAGTARASTV